jgi:uncharacterized membrane protein YdjX (TVP38/TMEM64 family)
VLRFFAKIEEFNDRGMVNDLVFITRLLPLVPCTLITFVGKCLTQVVRWDQCDLWLRESIF